MSDKPVQQPEAPAVPAPKVINTPVLTPIHRMSSTENSRRQQQLESLSRGYSR